MINPKEATDPTSLEAEWSSLPTTAEALLDYLAGLDITVTTYDHAPVFTVGEAHGVKKEWAGQGCKCLFLKDKKESRLWLVGVPDEKRVDLKELSKQLGCGRFSFASAETLREVLGVIPGAVTIFAAINDTQNQVEIVLDQDIMDRDIVNFHPLRNDKTTSIAPTDLEKFVRSCGHKPLVMVVPAQ